MRDHTLTLLSPPDFEVFLQCSCGIKFWSDGNGRNTVRNTAHVLVSACPMEVVERNLRRAAFPFFFAEGPAEYEVDLETKRRILQFLGIANSE